MAEFSMIGEGWRVEEERLGGLGARLKSCVYIGMSKGEAEREDGKARPGRLKSSHATRGKVREERDFGELVLSRKSAGHD
jgi:hypothetical protein